MHAVGVLFILLDSPVLEVSQGWIKGIAYRDTITGGVSAKAYSL